MRIEQSGHIGIGTNDPIQSLHLYNATTYADFGLEADARKYVIGVGHAGESSYSVPSKFYIFDNNATTMRFVIDTDGDIGIGTAVPSRRVHIHSDDDTRGILIHNTSTTSYAEMHLSASREYRVGTGGSGTGANAKDNWYVYDSTAAAHRFTINPSGDVGINDYSPSYKLDVNGTGRFVGALTLDAGLTLTGDTTMTGDLTVGGTVTAQEFHAEFVSSSIIYESGSTKFGDTMDDTHDFTGSINLLHPDAGGIALKDSTGVGLQLGEFAYTTNNSYTGITHTGLTGAADYMMISAGSDTYISAQNTSGVFIRGGGNNSTQEIQIPDADTTAYITLKTATAYFTGDVGIGTNNPGAKLQIGDGTAQDGITINALQASNNTILSTLMFENNGDTVAMINAYRGATGTAGELRFGTQATTGVADRMTITSAGYVGIGTTNPTYPLHIYSGDDLPLLVQSTDDLARILLKDNDTDVYIAAKDTHASIGGNNTLHANNMNINTSNGCVGFGTAAPSTNYRLHLVGSAGSTASGMYIQSFTNYGIFVNGTGTGTAHISGYFGGSGAATTNTALYATATGATNNYGLIVAAGDVGIGTTIPYFKAQIGGTQEFTLGYRDFTSDLHIHNPSATTAVGAYAGAITFGGTSATGATPLITSGIAAIQTGADSEHIGLAFFTHPSSDGTVDVAEAMRISAAGYVGIGTTSDDAAQLRIHSGINDIHTIKTTKGNRGNAL